MEDISPKEAVVKLKQPPENIIAAGRRHTVGLKSDGTVTVLGDNESGQCKLGDWYNIVAVAAGECSYGGEPRVKLIL